MKGRTVLKDRTWIHRNPRLFVGLSCAGSLLIFLSKPIYDIFFNPNVPTLEDLRREKRTPRF